MTEEPGKVLYDHSNDILEWTSLHCTEDPLCLSSEKLILKETLECITGIVQVHTVHRLRLYHNMKG